jgi:Mg2+/citrate symporter
MPPENERAARMETQIAWLLAESERHRNKLHTVSNAVQDALHSLQLLREQIHERNEKERNRVTFWSAVVPAIVSAITALVVSFARKG